MSNNTHEDTHTVKGPGLARGPALILGAILSFAGLVLFLHAGGTPTGKFPDGDATGSKFLGFESNGWTAFFTTTAGAVLLFAAAQHLLAKLLGLIVGIALGVAAILALVNGPGVLGLAAANWAVELGWGIAAVLLLLNVLAPRITKTETDDVHRHDRIDERERRSVEPATSVRPAASTGTTDNGQPRIGQDPAGTRQDGRDQNGGGQDGPAQAGPGQGATRLGG
jgi:hypothetical protein